MYRTFTSIMLGLGLGFLLLNPVNAEDTFSTVQGLAAEPMSQIEMSAIEGKWNNTMLESSVSPEDPAFRPFSTCGLNFISSGPGSCENDLKNEGNSNPIDYSTSKGSAASDTTGKATLLGINVHYMKKM